MHTVGPEICRETLKKLKNEKLTLQDLEYRAKTHQSGKCDTHTAGPGIWREN